MLSRRFRIRSTRRQSSAERGHSRPAIRYRLSVDTRRRFQTAAILRRLAVGSDPAGPRKNHPNHKLAGQSARRRVGHLPTPTLGICAAVPEANFRIQRAVSTISLNPSLDG